MEDVAPCCHSLVFVEVRAGRVCAGVSSLLLVSEEGGGVPPLGHAPDGGQARFGDGLGLGPAELLQGLVTGRGGFCCLASVVLFDCSLPQGEVILDDRVIHPCFGDFGAIRSSA